ncbi:ATP-binding protein [Methylomonas methanica]|uniref:histidine kinase n=1 Tax=Methylomonas methanica (strain DSM 25384 / MC09) TaxID=857087 RepID=G0A431_METMM|nr:ATP-binding protein [Methylomonas methanica]AEF99078.1 putative signal transduction histidine kinase [Methylomonas methanica MC09]
MSLRYQIIFRILLSSLCILLLGGAIAIWQARQAVEKEVDASIHLALQLITLGMADATSLQHVDDLSRFRALRQTRHLSIQLLKPDGQLVHFAGEQQPSHPEDMPPAWFIRAVKGDYPKVEHKINTQDGEILTLIIEAQPLDEITEVWQESLGFFSSLSLLTLLSFLAVNLVLNKSLKAIGVIVDALRMIETGQYKHQLPAFSTAEFDNIAKAINHMTVELEKTRQENSDLTQHSLAIQEEERQHLSQELHDEFGQSLTAIKVMAVTASRQAADVPKITATICDICDHLTLVLRSMMQQLHPLVLTELGLKATLEDMVNHWSERNPGLALSIVCSDEVDELDKNIARQVFRVIQECLTNVIRHADAKQVRIDLSVRAAEGKLFLNVADDGEGCDMQSINRGFGLRGIKERIKSLAGEVSLDSRPGAGMRISAWIPLV